MIPPLKIGRGIFSTTDIFLLLHELASWNYAVLWLCRQNLIFRNWVHHMKVR